MTSNKLKAYTNYWKCSLVDGELGRGVLTAGQAKALGAKGIDNSQLRTGELFKEIGHGWLEANESPDGSSPSLVQADLAKWTKDLNREWVKCVVYPFVYLLQTRHQHGWKSRRYIPEMIAPTSFTVLMHHTGKVLSYGRPAIARELLEPAFTGQPVVIGAMEDMDAYFNENPFPEYLDEDNPEEHERLSIEDVLTYNQQLLDQVCQKSLTRPLDEDDACLLYTSPSPRDRG